MALQEALRMARHPVDLEVPPDAKSRAGGAREPVVKRGEDAPRPARIDTHGFDVDAPVLDHEDPADGNEAREPLQRGEGRLVGVRGVLHHEAASAVGHVLSDALRELWVDDVALD